MLTQRLELSGSLDGGRTQPELIVHGHSEPLHQRPRVLAESLLARHELVAVVRVFHGALLEIVREADIVVRTENQARAFPLEPLADGVDFLRRGLLLGDQVIEAEHHQRVRVLEDARVDRQLLSRLVDALVDGHGMSGQLSHQLLETKQRQMEQFEGAGDPLQEHLSRVLGRLVAGQATRRTSVMVEKRLSISVTSRFASHG